jgi:hypothetical protein
MTHVFVLCYAELSRFLKEERGFDVLALNNAILNIGLNSGATIAGNAMRGLNYSNDELIAFTSHHFTATIEQWCGMRHPFTEYVDQEMKDRLMAEHRITEAVKRGPRGPTDIN